MALDLLSTAQSALRQYLKARGAITELVTAAGEQIHHYVVRGKGRGGPALLIHGLGGSANGYYRLLFSLSRRFSSVHAVDLPGHGFSPPARGGPLPLEGQLEVLDHYASTVVRDPALVVGNSLGGAMSLRLAGLRPSFVRALALVCPAGARMTPEGFEQVRQALLVKTTKDAAALTMRLFHRLPVGWLLFSSELKKMYGTPAVRKVFSETTSDMHLAPEELPHRAAHHHLALAQDGHPIAHRLDVAQDVGREEDGPAPVALGEDEVLDLLAADRIEAAHRLVEDEHLRVRDERRREAGALEHALERRRTWRSAA